MVVCCAVVIVHVTDRRFCEHAQGRLGLTAVRGHHLTVDGTVLRVGEPVLGASSLLG